MLLLTLKAHIYIYIYIYITLLIIIFTFLNLPCVNLVVKKKREGFLTALREKEHDTRLRALVADVL
jgi:hypothetical protein